MLRSGFEIKSFCEATIGALAVLAIGGAAYGIYGAGLYKPTIGEQRVITAARGSGGETVTVATRQVLIGSHRFWQVEVAPGVWKDCGRDCAKVLRNTNSR